MDLERRTARTPDGAALSYRVRPGDRPRILLHALGCDGSLWDGAAAALPARDGLLVPDLRGHGGSTTGWRAPSVELWAEDVAFLALREGLDRPAVAGISMGGYVALALAELRPDLPRCLALVASHAAPDDDAARLRRAAMLDRLREGGPAAVAAAMLPDLLAPGRPGRTERERAVTAMFARAGAVGLAGALHALAGRPDRRPRLGALPCPLVVVAGEEDPLVPPARALETAAAAPGARLVRIPGAGHLCALEEPAAVAAALAAT